MRASSAVRARASRSPRATRRSSSGRATISPSAASTRHIVVCDVGNRDEANELIDEVVERTGRIDVLINNAGVIKVGPLEHMELADFEEAMAVHFWGPLHDDARGDPGDAPSAAAAGSSTCRRSAGKIGVPHLTPYCASKFALAGLSESIRGEIAKDGIHVTTVCPGMMRTGSPFNAWFKGRHREEFAWFAIADSLPVASIDAAARRVADRRRVPPRRRRAGDRLAGEARRDRERGDAAERRARRWTSPTACCCRRPTGEAGNRVAQRLAEPVGPGAVEADDADGACGRGKQRAAALNWRVGELR